MAELKFTGRAVILLLALVVIGIQQHHVRVARAEPIQLTAVLPKLEALHDEARALLLMNAQLKRQILSGLQKQNEAKIKFVRSSRLLMTPSLPSSGNQINTAQAPGNKTELAVQKQQQQQQPIAKFQGDQQVKNSTQHHKHQHEHPAASVTMKQKGPMDDQAHKSMIDFGELEDFNKWVEINLEYAVKNTQATAEALREEALHNNGTVDYSTQAIKDGKEGVNYWQSAVLFQDKTLKNEKFDSIDS